jgi:predicted metal-binding protein
MADMEETYCMKTKHTLFVCKSCSFSRTQQQYMGQRGGFHLLSHLSCLYQNWALQSEFVIQAVDCLSACDRPCTVAFAAPNKNTLMFGDLQPLASAAAVLQLGEQYFASADGIVPRQERPEALKKGILARIPPSP